MKKTDKRVLMGGALGAMFGMMVFFVLNSAGIHSELALALVSGAVAAAVVAGSANTWYR